MFGSKHKYLIFQDFLRFVPELPENIEVRELPNFNHFDVIWADEAPKYLFMDIVKDLRVVNQHTLKDVH